MSEVFGQASEREQRVAKSIFALGSGQVFTWLSSIALLFILPRALGSEDLGRCVVALLIVTFIAPLADLGTSTYLIKEIPRRDAASASSLIANALLLKIPVIAVSLIVYAVVALFVINDGATRSLLLLFIPQVIMQALASVTTSALRGWQAMGSAVLAESLPRCANVCVFAVMLLAGFGITSAAVAGFIANALGLIISTKLVLSRNGTPRGLDPQLWKPMILAGLPFFGLQATIVLHGQLDVILLSRLANLEVTGWYAAAYKVVSIPIFIPAIVVGAFFPAISQVAVQDREHLALLARRALHLIVLGMVPIALGTLLLAGPLLRFLGYSSDFDGAVPLLSILALHLPLVGINMVVAVTAFALDAQSRWLKIMLCITVVDLILNLSLVPLAHATFDNGAIAAASITLFTEVVVLLVGLRVVPAGVFGRDDLLDAARCLAAGAIMCVPVFLLRDIFILVPSLAGAAVFMLAAAWLGAIRREDVQFLRQAFNRRVSASSVPEEAVALS